MQTTTQEARANGAGPSRALAAAADLLAERLGEIDARMRELDTLRAEHRQVTTALRAIAPEHPLLAPAPAKPGPKPKPASGWVVSQGKRDAVLAALRSFDAPASVSAVARRANVAGETARRALEQMRDDELVRVARTERGPGGTQKFYAPMPEGDRGA